MGRRAEMETTAEPTDDEHALLSSTESEHLLDQASHDVKDFDHVTGSWWLPGSRHFAPQHVHSVIPTPRRPRWMTIRPDLHADNNLMRGLRRRRCTRLGLGTLIFIGVIQLLSLLGGLLIVYLPGGIHRIIDKWGQRGHIGQGLSSWPTDFSRDIIPVPCHSHNDYWRRVPLYSAIEAGCISVEADVWLFDKQLYVGHSLASLTPNRTLASLYVDPLLHILEKQNPTTRFHPDGNQSQHGVFDTVPEQSLTLLIDFKTSGSALFPYVVAALEPLRSSGHLTHRNGTQIVSRPITVIGTGNTPFNLVNSDLTNPHLDIFFDAPLAAMWEGLSGAEKSPPAPEPEPPVYGADIDASIPEVTTPAEEQRSASESDMGQGMSGAPESPDAYTTENSIYASVSFTQAIGHVLFGKLSDSQMNLIRGHIRGAHRRGLKVRYWELPFWPIGLRNYVWDVLVKEGVDILNVDDLNGATKLDWGKKSGWW
ncbi:MAG: hypothetical protein Q9186_006000 [Xanthomendoza sp. 1 TL-2023]